MLKKTIILCALLVFSFGQAHAADTIKRPDKEKLKKILSDFEEYAKKGMQDWQIPGMAIAIVQEDQVIYSQAFGTKTAGKNEPVTTHTIFQIGSTSKAFTSTLAAMLVDDGKIQWEDKVIDHLPDFRMYDPWVTREFMFYDLFSQHSGMPPYAADGQASFGFDREHIIQSLRFIQPVSSFRAKFAYVNNLFLVAAKIIEKYTGKTWEDNLKSKIFQPLGMVETTADVKSYVSAKDVATPHNIRQGKPATVPMDLDWNYIYGPAGGINSNVTDMAQWLKLHINDGMFAKKQLVSAKNLNFTHSPKTIAMTDPHGRNIYYCLSWCYEEAEPYSMIWHNGGTTGCHTMLAFWPQAKIGIVILTNLCPNELAESLARYFGELYFGNPSRDWSKEELDKAKKAKLEAEKEKPQLPAKVTPGLALDSYTGKYHNDIYEDLTVEKKDNSLVLTIGPRNTEFALKHWDRDNFILTYAELGDDEAQTFVNFEVGEKGKADKVTLELLNQDGCGVFVRK